ncbi:recombinase family protein [Rhizobium mongolense]|uniref:recombinase family protein n=1 Tax=Rhizobium mongolense TaxID=57676 RepID=UPI003F61F7D3
MGRGQKETEQLKSCHLFASLAQFERGLIRERTRAGLQERGRRGGRQAVVTPEKLVKARKHPAAGLTVREAAARVKIGKTALYEALKAISLEFDCVAP